MVHIMAGWYRQHTAVVGQPVDRAHTRMVEALHLAKLAQMEKQSKLSGHGPKSEEGSQDLGEHEEQVDGMDGSF